MSKSPARSKANAMTNQADIPRPCTCTTVRKASRLLARVYDSALQPSELNVTQLAVLRAIERMPGAPLSQVADSLSMDRTSMYRSVAAMEKQDWLKVEAGRDARSRCAKLRPRGRAVLRRAAPHWESVQGGVVESFGRERWQRLVAELDALGEVASAWETASENKNHGA